MKLRVHTNIILLLIGITLTAAEPQPEGLQSLVSQFASQNSGGDVQSLSYCRISTRDLISTAQSTVNRVLQGVCNPRDLNNRLETLTTQMIEQFNVLKTMVLNVEDKLRHQDGQVKRQHRKIQRTLAMLLRSARGGVIRNVPGFDAAPGVNGALDPFAVSAQDDEYDEYEYIINDDFQDEKKMSPRFTEIKYYNSTIHSEEGQNVFTYFWTIKDIRYKMKNWGWRRSLRSESFYIQKNGYRMYMKIFPNKEGKNVYIHVGLTKGDYDDDLEWPFKLKHRIQVLDFWDDHEDLISRVWDPQELCSGWNWEKPTAGDNYECVGLGFPQTELDTRGYLHNDSIVVKLTVFTDL